MIHLYREGIRCPAYTNRKCDYRKPYCDVKSGHVTSRGATSCFVIIRVCYGKIVWIISGAYRFQRFNGEGRRLMPFSIVVFYKNKSLIR